MAGSLILERIIDSQKETSEDTSTATDAKLVSSVQAIAGEINLLYRLSNTIRRASRESQNLKAAGSYHILDDDGNDSEPMLQEIFANYICGRFPSIHDNLRQRLASSMVLRRRRILYRRRRYGESPIRVNKTITQPKIQIPQTQRQGPVILDLTNEGAEAAESTVGLAQAKSTVRSLAVSATTLAVDNYKKALTPSVISATKTVALGSHEDLVFPPAPNGRIKLRYKRLEKQRRQAHQAYITSLPGYYPQAEHGENAPAPLSDRGDSEGTDSLPELRHKISEAETKLQTGLESDWNDCHKALPELTCPFCFYALPSFSVSDDNKWKYVPAHLYAHTSGVY